MKKTINYFFVDIKDRHSIHLEMISKNEIFKGTKVDRNWLYGAYTLLRQEMLKFEYAKIDLSNDIEKIVTAGVVGFSEVEQFDLFIELGVKCNLFIFEDNQLTTPEVQEAFKAAQEKREKASKRKQKSRANLNEDGQNNVTRDTETVTRENETFTRELHNVTSEIELKERKGKERKENKHKQNEIVFPENSDLEKVYNDIIETFSIFKHDIESKDLARDAVIRFSKNDMLDDFKKRHSDFKKHIKQYPKYRGQLRTYLESRWMSDRSFVNSKSQESDKHVTQEFKNPAYKKIKKNEK